jgi:hypothetical protein
MGASPRWAVVDELVHELGSLRAVVQEIESQPGLTHDDEVALELRASLARAADTIHLVIGGDEGLLAQARRCIAEARVVGERALLAVERSRATHSDTRAIRERTRAQVRQAKRHIGDLQDMQDANDARRLPKKEPRLKA